MYSNSNENMLFLRKTDETIWKPLFQLTPLFMTPLFGQISERRYRGGGDFRMGGNYDTCLVTRLYWSSGSSTLV